MSASVGQVAVVGAGPWGKNHVKTFAALGALGAVADASPALRAEIETQYPGIPTYASLETLLSAFSGAIVLATPAPTHFTLARQALLAGRDVLVEKPMTLRSEEARELARIAEERGRILMVGHLLLFQPAIRWIREFLKEGRLGRVLTLSQTRANFGRARATENALWSLGVHDVAVMLELLGEAPASVDATGVSALTPGVEDDVRVAMRFPSGVTAFVHSSWLSPIRRRELVVVGTEGMLVFDELERTVTLHKKRFDGKLGQSDGGTEVVFRQEEEPLTLEDRYFLDRLADRKPPCTDGRHGAAVVAVLEEAMRRLATPGPRPRDSRALRADGPEKTL